MVKSSCQPCGLAKYLNIVGGICIDQALRQADANLLEMRESAIHMLDHSIDRLFELRSYSKLRPSEKVIQAMHAEANNIVGIAGSFGYGSIGVAAKLLCEYLDLLELDRAWDPEGVILHCDAMRCLRALNGSEDCERILKGLQQLTLHAASRRAVQQATRQ